MLKNFFLFCSGSYNAILNRTPSDVNKHIGIGATIFFTGLFASIAAGFALYTVFKSYWVAIPFGIIWGMMIFNLDRYIVMSMKKKGNFLSEILTATPRLLLAVLIAFVIAKPLELKLFQSEINTELSLMEQERNKELETALSDRFDPDIKQLNSDISILEQKIEVKRLNRDSLQLMALAEADGTGGSKKRNMGPIYAAKKAEADKADLELKEIASTTQLDIQNKKEQISKLELQKEQSLNEIGVANLDGFAAQLDALGRLSNKSQTIFWASIFITLLFIAIETAPIITKLISHKSPFDHRLESLEYKYKLRATREMVLNKIAIDGKLNFEKDLVAHQRDELVKAEKELITNLVEEELGKLKTQPLTWKDYLKRKRLFEY